MFQRINNYNELSSLLEFGDFRQRITETKFIEDRTITLESLIEQAIQFKNKNEYLAWSKEWKRLYTIISKDIRDAKRVYRRLNQEPYYIRSVAQIEYLKLKSVANLLLIMRKKSKELSHQQYLQSKKSLLSKIIGKINGAIGS